MKIEQNILDAAATLAGHGQPEFYGYLMARTLDDGKPWWRITGHGTLYRALDRLIDAGYLERRWETNDEMNGQERPRRRYYKLTTEGARRAAPASPEGES